MDRNYLIGKENGLPWNLPADMTHFKRNTLGKTIVMGRKTADSLPNPLVGRNNIVLSRQQMAMKGFVIENSVENILKHYRGSDIFVIGGAEIYRAFLPYADRLIITRILDYFEGDTHFPIEDVKWEQWDLSHAESHMPDERNKYSYIFQTYTKRRNVT
jgi:dihydrofolate reductase